MTGSERLAQLDQGRSPLLIARMRSGFAVMGDSQYLPGYCLILAFPEANHLTDLNRAARAQYLDDMGLLGEAVMQVTECKRVNYAILGNLDPFLHAHVWPRYEWEDEQYRHLPPTSFPAKLHDVEIYGYSEPKHGPIRQAIADHLLLLSGG